ncbi:MCE family protein [Mycolicibacterium holsaticum]|uniref:Mammalian cell entry protein n=1 Tax=Mycolicibacterium holsaticum TaxID=152142 RepID=A0A1E3S2L7_9MYCO|nr:MCE family protein [Mycolicibacterium holsaticum]ODQ96369.1 mammalian cell entry protein [Mycolicibacterium holsaticum]
MRNDLPGTIWRLTVFVSVCAVFMVAMFAVFGGLRFRSEGTYNAVFADISGLQEGQFVRIGGVEVGQVKHIELRPDTTVRVAFSADDSVVLTQGTRAVIRYDDLIGGRYMALQEGTGNTMALDQGQTIPISHTTPGLDLDALIGGFRPLFRALDPDQVNALTGQLINAFEGQGDTIVSFFTNIAALSATLADRDQLVGQVITNLSAVLSSLGDQRTKFAEAVESLSQLVETLAERRAEISGSVVHTDAAADTVADLLAQGRAPMQKVVGETDRVAGIVVADKDYMSDLLDGLPEKYKVLARQGMYGDFINFYLCDLVLKVNGKGGQPVYIKIAGQSSGRCASK